MTFLEEREFSDTPDIPEFYRGKSIFITGGTGFMGKVLVEKLLYSCSELDRIYLLMRHKKGVAPEVRVKDLFSSMCFDRLRKERPGIIESKVCVMGGDVTELGLGLSQQDRELIINNVNIIFHVAASVRFDDPLLVAAKLNLRGTREVVALAKEIKDLKAMVHVSTSYSNTNREVIEEVMYPPLADWRETLEICENLDEHTLEIFTTKYLGVLPNTYTFTKQLAEHVIYEQKGQLPIVIIRPSIVISSVEEPAPGWIENFNGPVGILVACGKGIMRSIYSDPNLIADYVPVDVSIKSFVAAAWVRGTKKLEPTDDIPIYNCCASNLNHITMGELVELGKKIGRDYPLNTPLWNIGGQITTCLTWHYFKVFFLQLLPSLFVDLMLWLLGKKTMLIKVQRRILIANMALNYYITQQWTFDNKNLISLRSSIKEKDKKSFYYDIENVDKYQYFVNSSIGGKRYLLKEEEDYPKAKRYLFKLLILDKAVQCIFYGYLFYFLINLDFTQNILNSILGAFY